METRTHCPKRSVLLYLALLAASAPGAAAGEPETTWITLGDAAYTELRKTAPQAVAKYSRAIRTNYAGGETAATEIVHVLEADEGLMLKLTATVHRELKRCGGFMAHASEAEAREALDKPAMTTRATFGRPSYVIGEQAMIVPLLAQMQDSHIAQTIADMSAFANRYYKTANGNEASNWLRQKWASMSASRSDMSVVQIAHAGYDQKSVILTIDGTDNASEIVVLGAHLDTINLGGTRETTTAPGADDDASGIASMTEALRVMLANNYRPRRTIKLIGYAAEEVGLRGSQAIARNFKASNVNVVGVMQLDMTNYKGSTNDIYIFTDYTDNLQNEFIGRLVSTYLPTLTIGRDKCGYACSDHAAWHAQGYAASMPFESTIKQDNPHIHTARDTYANSGSQALHALKFARVAAAYAIELGSEGPATVAQ